jgi:hypothetical protein
MTSVNFRLKHKDFFHNVSPHPQPAKKKKKKKRVWKERPGDFVKAVAYLTAFDPFNSSDMLCKGQIDPRLDN